MAASDDLLDQEAARIRGPQQKTYDMSASDAMLESEVATSKARATAVLDMATKRNPDKAAEANALSAQFKLDIPTVERNQEELSRLSRIQQLHSMVAASPVLARQMADPGFATIAHDDVGVLSSVAAAAKYLTSAPGTQRGLVGDIGAAATIVGVGGLAGVGKMIFDTAGAGADIFGGLSGSDALRNVGATWRAQGTRAGEAIQNLTPSDGWWNSSTGKAVSSGLSSAGTNLAMLPLGIERGIANGAASASNWVAGLLGVGTGADAYSEARNKDKTILQSLLYAVPQGAFEYAFEKIPAAKLFKDLAAGKSTVKAMIGQAVPELWTEQLTTVAQDFNTWMNMNPGKTASEFVAERPEAAYQTLVATLIGVGLQSGGARLISKAFGADEELQRRAQVAEQHATVLEGMQKTMEASKLLERSPEHLQSYAQDLVNDNVPQVFVDSAKLVEAGINLQELAAAVPSVAAQLDQVQTGGDLVIPTGELLTGTIGSAFAQPLIDNARTDVNGMSRAEAKDYMAEKGDKINAEIERVLAERQDDATFKEGRDQVQAQILQQLNTIQRFTPKVNEQYAALAANFYAVMAARTGMTVQDFAARYKLGFDANTANGSQVMDQGVSVYKALPTLGFERLARGDSRNYQDTAGKEFPTFVRDGVTISLSSNGSLYEDRGAVIEGYGEPEESIVRGLIVDKSERGQGKAAKALGELAAAADAAGTTLYLEPTPIGDGGMNAEQLAAFYKKFGFKQITAGSDKILVREPTATFEQAANALDKAVTDEGGKVKDLVQIDQLIDSKDVPTLTMQDLVGKKIFPTIADRTAAAALYTGIDSSQIQISIPLLGGPLFPLRQSNVENDVVWANRGKSVTSQKGAKIKEGANFMLVTLGDANMHQSNTTVNNAFFATLEAYVRDKRILKKNAAKLTKQIRESQNADPMVQKYMEEFPGLDDAAKLDEYLHRISFSARSRLLGILGNKGAQELGAPSMQQILDATREPSLAGHNWGDGVLLVEIDQNEPMVNLGEDGTQPHPDFPLGIKGKVVGKMATPINYKLLWQDWLAKAETDALARGTAPEKINTRRAFELGKPIVEVTQELVDRIGPLNSANIDGPRQAKLASDFAADNWKTSDTAVNKGGVSQQEFVDAIQNSTAKAVLTEYTAAEIKAVVKSGSTTLYQLGEDGQIFFALKKGDPGYAQDYKVETPGITDNEVMLTSVINNEQGARGIGGPAVVLKALAEGATVLDCFAVKNDKHPNGYLPMLYSEYGFKPVAEVPFNPKFYSKQKLADAVKFWKDSTPGYDPEVHGYPSLVIMKWEGTDADRTGILERYLRAGSENLLQGRAHQSAEEFADLAGGNDRAQAGSAGPGTDASGAGGNQGASAGYVPSRAQRTVQSVANLNDNELKNLGLTAKDRDAVRKALGLPIGGLTLNQPAFHGTPHRGIQQFSTDKIGTGEGAQAYGWGLYFASKREIAEHYRKGLSYRDMVNKFRNEMPEDADTSEALDWAESGDAPADMARVIKALAENDWLGFDYPSQALTALFKEPDSFDISGELKSAADAMKGQLYEVEIPEDSEMLLWDKPLSEQAQADLLREIANEEDLQMEYRKKGLHGARTGEDFYKAMSQKLGSDEAASRVLESYGVKGIKFLDGTSRSAGEGSYNYVVFRGDDVAIKNQFYQNARGQIAFGNDITQQASIISLLKNADLSTFIHESGHFFLEVQADLASRIAARMAHGEQVTDGEKSILDDFTTTLKWMGVTGDQDITHIDQWAMMTADEKRPHHEQFARGFEAYAFEGKAPSLELQSVFQTFRAWLVNVYRTVKDKLIGDTLNVQLNDEVRAVMDRMLATTDAIQEAEAARSMGPLFKSAEEGGMDLEAYKLYHDMSTQATQDAIQELQGKGLRDMQWLQNARSRKLKELQKQHDALRAQIAREVRAEVMRQPIYQVWAFLTSKTGDQAQAGVTDLETADLTTAAGKLRTQVLREMYGTADDAIWRKLSALRMTSDENGLHPDLVAERFGFQSGDELVQKLTQAEPPQSVIEGRTDQRMLEEHGDLATPAGLERAADAAIHNDARVRFVATELRALQHAMSVREKVPGQKNTVDVLARAAREHATALIARLKVRDIRPAQYAAAEARAAKAAEKARGDLAKQTEAKRNQLINLWATKAAYAAQDEVKSAIEYFKKFDKVSKSLDPEYQSQIHALLERFDLRQSVSLKEIEKRKSLVEWVADQVDQGLEPNIPPGLLQEANRKSFKEMTVEEIRGLRDTIKQIEHLGRLKNKLLTAQEQRDFSQAVAEITGSIAANANGRTAADTRTPNTLPELALQSLKNFWASHIKAATWARVMDGGKDGGKVWEYLIRTANDAGNNEVVMREKATKELAKLVAPVLKQGKMGGKGVHFDSINRTLNREAVLAIALNVGNASNLQRLLGGENWNVQQILPVLDTLTAEEWQFVQAVWDHFESYRPMIAAKETRVYGKEPDWVEPTPVQTKFGVLRGGYYPIKYDPRASGKAEMHADAEAAKQQLKGAYTSATTRRSFTKTRVEEVNGRPLLYSLDGIYNGVQEVIHDLTWHEWLIDANKLLRNKSVDASIRSTYGPDVVRQFKDWVADNAEGGRGAQGAGEMAAAWVRQGVSVSGLGLNVMSAIMQPLGLTQSIVRIGPKWVARGISKAIGSPLETADAINEKSEFMRTRALTRLREIAEVRSQVKGRSQAREVVDASAYFLMMRCQQLVDVPTWWGAYEKAIAEGNSEDRAVALSDQAVIDAQGSGGTKDQSAIERGGQTAKLFTVFYSFFNTALNLGVGQTMTHENKAKLAADYLLLFTVPALLGAVLKDALTPGDSGDWDDPEKMLKRLIGEQISFLMGLMVGVREMAGAVQAVTGTSQFGTDYSGPAGTRFLADLVKLGKQIHQGEMDDGLRKAIVNTAGELLRLPSAQINRTITGAQALADGKTSNPGVLLTGYQEPH